MKRNIFSLSSHVSMHERWFVHAPVIDRQDGLPKQSLLPVHKGIQPSSLSSVERGVRGSRRRFGRDVRGGVEAL